MHKRQVEKSECESSPFILKQLKISNICSVQNRICETSQWNGYNQKSCEVEISGYGRNRGLATCFDGVILCSSIYFIAAGDITHIHKITVSTEPTKVLNGYNFKGGSSVEIVLTSFGRELVCRKAKNRKSQKLSRLFKSGQNS